MLVNAGLSDRERRGQGSCEVGDHLGRGRTASGASSCAIARRRVHGAAVQEGRLQALLEDRQCLSRIGFTREGNATSFLPGVAFLLALLAQVFVHGALRLRLARC